MENSSPAGGTRVDGRTRLLDTAEELLDRHGIDGVSVRTVTKAAGHRNSSAVNYHFGNREQLVAAVLQRRQVIVEERRSALLDELEGAGTLDARAAVDAAVRPLADMLDCPEGRCYLRLLHQAANHPDYYLRVVDRNDEGIVVRGAKAHISAAAYFNEIFVVPCRNMSEDDADYAVSFAIPVDTAGVVQIAHPIKADFGPLDFPVEGIPLRWHTDSLVIFDDVFVPWERVFLCGEWAFAMPLVYNFAYFHRHTAASYRVPVSEMMVGMAMNASITAPARAVMPVGRSNSSLIHGATTIMPMKPMTTEGIPARTSTVGLRISLTRLGAISAR